MEENFWRLFSDYEDLTRDQTTAIVEWNHAALRIVHEKKAVILCELVRIAALLGLDRGNPVLKIRWSRLVAAEKSNAALMSETLAKARLESQMLHNATQRLRAIEHVYAGEAQQARRSGAFFAHG